MRKFKCICGYRSVHADSQFYLGQIYIPYWESVQFICFKVEEYEFHFHKNGLPMKNILREIKPFRYGK